VKRRKESVDKMGKIAHIAYIWMYNFRQNMQFQVTGSGQDTGKYFHLASVLVEGQPNIG
jgi:hypothetical protein